MASTVMPNGSFWSLRVLPAQAEELVAVDLELRQVVAESSARSAAAAKTSLPAGTGVCVVKQVPAATASRAVAKSSRVSSISARMRSRPQNAECPSFMWQTVGGLPRAPQGADAADAEDHFLADAHVVVAAVEPGGDGAVFRRVLRDVGVEQVERHPADLDAPDAHQHFAAGERDADQQRRAVASASRG